MSEIKFEKATQPVPRDAESLTAFAEALRHNKGRWALLGQTVGITLGSSRQWAYSISANLPGLPGRAFGPGYRAEHRTVVGERRVYVCYVGPSGE